jgi:hypothetical protein
MHVREVTSVARNLALLIRRIIDQTRQYFDQLASASLSPTLSIDAIMQNPEPPLHLLQQSVRYMIAQLNEQLGSIVSLKIPHILCHQEALSPFRVIEDDISLIQCHVIELVEEFPLFSEALDTLFDTGFKFTRMFMYVKRPFYHRIRNMTYPYSEHQHDEADATRIELMLAFDPQPDDSESDNDDNPTTPPCAPSDLTLYHSNTTEYKDVIES